MNEFHESSQQDGDTGFQETAPEYSGDGQSNGLLNGRSAPEGPYADDADPDALAQGPVISQQPEGEAGPDIARVVPTEAHGAPKVRDVSEQVAAHVQRETDGEADDLAVDDHAESADTSAVGHPDETSRATADSGGIGDDGGAPPTIEGAGDNEQGSWPPRPAFMRPFLGRPVEIPDGVQVEVSEQFGSDLLDCFQNDADAVDRYPSVTDATILSLHYHTADWSHVVEIKRTTSPVGELLGQSVSIEDFSGSQKSVHTYATVGPRVGNTRALTRYDVGDVDAELEATLQDVNDIVRLGPVLHDVKDILDGTSTSFDDVSPSDIIDDARLDGFSHDLVGPDEEKALFEYVHGGRSSGQLIPVSYEQLLRHQYPWAFE